MNARVVALDFTGVRLASKPEEIRVGERNNMLLLRLSQDDAVLCETKDELTDIAVGWNAQLPEPMSRKEVSGVVRSKWNWLQTREGVIRRAALIRIAEPWSIGTWTSATDVSQDFESYAIHGVLPESGKVNLHGPAGSMKTAVAIDMACHIALGLPWHGRDIDLSLMIAYIASENPTSVKRRVRAWARDHGIGYEKLARKLFVWSGVLDLNSPQSVIDFARSIPALISLAGGTAPRVWIVDTLATAMSGDENTKAIQDAVQAIYHAITGAIRTEPLVIFVHHTGKDEAREERGHSSLRAVVDTAIKIEAGESSGAQPSKVQPSVLIKRGLAIVRKQRDGVDGQVFAFEVHAILVGFDDKGRPRSQVVVRHSKDIDEARGDVAAKRARRPGAAKTITAAILEAFNALAGESGEVPQKDLLEAVAKDLGKDPERMRAHGPRDIARAGLTSSQARPGAPSIVRRA
jgi:hypothetical protein